MNAHLQRLQILELVFRNQGETFMDLSELVDHLSQRSENKRIKQRVIKYIHSLVEPDVLRISNVNIVFFNQENFDAHVENVTLDSGLHLWSDV